MRLVKTKLPGGRLWLAFWYGQKYPNGYYVVTYERSYIVYRKTSLPIPIWQDFFTHTLSDDLRVKFWFDKSGVLARTTSEVRRMDCAPISPINSQCVRVANLPP